MTTGAGTGAGPAGDTPAGAPRRGRTAGRLAGLTAAVGLVFAGGWAVGSTSGPALGVDVGPRPVPAALPGSDPGIDPAADPESATMGLATTRSGYTLTPVTTVLPWEKPTEVAFTITGSDGTQVRSFAEDVDVAVIRRDDAGYDQLRATRGPDGVWRAPVTFPGAGVWRLYAGFTPAGGPPLDLGADLFVPGPFGPFTFTTEQRSVDTGPFRVRLDGDLLPGGPTRLFATLSRGGAPVTDLQPVAGSGGAFGRLVAVRQGDLARVPLRAEVTGAGPGATAGPAVAFTGALPSAGSYRLFLTFTQGGVERTCEFTVDASAGN